MAFIQQLRLLLWKNCLTVIRRPIWSLTLVLWPVIIFSIIAVTRHHFPPVVNEACYVKPRNLPSTGVFPFLQTLMCNTDSRCQSKSQLGGQSASQVNRQARSNTLLEDLIQDNILIDLPENSNDRGTLLKVLEKIFGPTNTDAHEGSFMNTSTTSQEDKEKMNKLKNAICKAILPMINATSPETFAFVSDVICKSNRTVFEASLSALNKILTQLMVTNPEEMAKLTGVALLVFDQLQNETSLWEILIAFPQVLSSGSTDQVLRSANILLSSMHSAVHIIQQKIPEVAESLSKLRSVLAGIIDVLRYAENWPGKDVSISLGEVVNVTGGQTADLVRNVLQVNISLDMAIFLVFDRELVYHHLCSNSSNPMCYDALFGTSIVRVVLGWVSPELVFKQIFLAWIKEVAQHDIPFAIRLLHSLIGNVSLGRQGGSNATRAWVDTQNENTDVFLGIGFEYMKTATLTLETIEEIMEHVLKDAEQLQQSYLMLLTNQSEANVWITRVVDSVVEAIMTSLASEDSTCDDILSSFEWLLNSNTIDIDLWQSVICQKSSALQKILMDIEQFFTKPTQITDYNVTLPMIVSEWHTLRNKSLQFGDLLDRVATNLGVAYWMNWIPVRTHDITGTLKQSLFIAMVKSGETIEGSQLWPEIKSYFHIAFWMLNYMTGITTQPPNCTYAPTFHIVCNTAFNWPQFAQLMTQVLMSQNEDGLLNFLKGSVVLLQHVYGDLYKSLARYSLESVLDNDVQVAYLLALMHNLDDFVHTISKLPDQQISNLTLLDPLFSQLFHYNGLAPLLPLLFGDHPINVSTVLDVVLKVGRFNQQVLTFNVSTPAMAELERLIVQLFSLEANLTMPLSHIMGHTLFTYSLYLRPEAVAHLRKSLQPFVSQNSAGYVEAILKAMELFKTGIDNSNGDPTPIILSYIRQLQGLVKSLVKLRTIQQIKLPSGELSTAQVTDLSVISQDFLNLLTPESLQNLTQAGPDAAQNIVIERFVALLPPEIQEEATHFLQDFKALQYHVAQCAAGQNCLAGVSEIFTFLDQILDMMLLANGSATLNIAVDNAMFGGQGREGIASLFFSLLLSSNDTANVETFRGTLNFIRQIMATPNITVSDVQYALRQSNLTLAELNHIASLAGSTNINDLIGKILDIINAQQCFETQPDPIMCVLELIAGVSSFLTNVPALHNETAIISFITQIVRNTIINAFQINLPLNSTLANVTMSLQQSNLLTPEIKNELAVLEDLIKLGLGALPFNNDLNISMMDPTEVQLVALKLIDWYLKRMINISSNSAFSDLLEPFFYVTQMQLTIQLATTNVSEFVRNQIELLLNNLQFPLDGAGLRKIGLTAVTISRSQCELIFFNLKLQMNYTGSMPFFNTTLLNAAELQVKQYLDLIEMWLKQPNLTSVFSSMLQWGNSSTNIFTPLTDLQHLLGTVMNFLSDDQRPYLNVIHNVTQSLRKALQVAEQPGGLQSEHFFSAIVEAVQILMQFLTESTAPLPPSVQQDILEIVHFSIKLIVHRNMSFASSQNISLIILEKAEGIIQIIAPEDIAEYLLLAIKIAKSYVKTVSTADGPDWFNEVIFDQMMTIQSLLPPNSSAQTYLSVIINITQVILGQGNMTVMGSLGHETVDKLAVIFSKLIMGKADQSTWEKLEELLRDLLSTFRGTEFWDKVPSVFTLFEKIFQSMVKIKQAENVLIQSLQGPLVTLMREIAQSANTSHFNFSDISERIQHTIEHMVRATQQANGTLNCTEVLLIWEPVREAVGLNHSTIAMWCNINLQPLLEAYDEATRLCSSVNMTHMGVGPMTVNTTAARIVNIVQILYQISINSSLVIQQLSMTFSNEVTMVTGQPLSAEAQLQLYNMLQRMMLQNSLNSFQLLSNNLPELPLSHRPFINAIERAQSHILNNYHRMQNFSSSMDVVREAAEIFLKNAFPLSSGLNEYFVPDIVRKIVKLMIDLKIFGDAPMVYEELEQSLASNDTTLIVHSFYEMFVFLNHTNASGLDLLTLPRIYNALKPVFSLLIRLNVDLPPPFEVFVNLAENIGAMLVQMENTGGLMTLMENHGSSMYRHGTRLSNSTKSRYRHEALLPSSGGIIEDLVYLYRFDYQPLGEAIRVPPTTNEIMETIYLLGITLLPTIPTSSNADGVPYVRELKNNIGVLANESQEKILMQKILKTVAELLQISLRDDRFTKLFHQLHLQVCELEQTESVHQMLMAFSARPGLLCDIGLPILQLFVQTLGPNGTSVIDMIFQFTFGDPNDYNVLLNWTSVLTDKLGFDANSLTSLEINITSPGEMTVGEMFRDKQLFISDVQQHMDFESAALQLLLETRLPNRNVEILSWLINLRHCTSTVSMNMNATDVAILKTFCSFSADQWYIFSVLVARHVNVEKVIYRMVLSEEVQSFVGFILQVVKILTKTMDSFAPVILKLHSYSVSMSSIIPGNFSQYAAINERSSLSGQATFVTLSRALCSNGIMAVIGMGELKFTPDSTSSMSNSQREEMIKRFNIPQDATPFCTNMYLDMVSTTGGAIAWAFLKPLLMGHILYTPDTPVTRAIMEKANATLQEFANLRKNAQNWIESSKYIEDSAQLLKQTLPLLQNSLSNAFVKNFIEMQTDIDVSKMRETLSNFSNMTVLLEKNKDFIKQITILSTLMVQLSSCIKFDRYHGYDSAEELNAVAQDLAIKRDLYASVIFKLPKDEDSSRPSSSTSSLPPKVSYTIRMHMDNVMRTDRVRNPYFTKDSHISARMTLRYNRGFVYLQESIDRAIIETQTGQRVTELAVQLQPFSYPCHIRDEYLEGISFVFPLVLMLAWVLFIADFVKKLVHERELRLHEYMKMMGVNPLSHFFAWFLECAAFLVLTIFILTLVLKFGSILPKSNGFVIFLYLCDYGLSILAFSYLVSSFFDKTYIAGLSGSLIYILSFFPFIMVMAVETSLTFSQKNMLSLFSPTCFSYASQYITRYEAQGEGIQWHNSYKSPISQDTASFGWLCWLMLIDSMLYFIIGSYIRMVFPGKYGIPAPWYFPFKASFWENLCCHVKSKTKVGSGLLFTNIMQKNHPLFMDGKGKGQGFLSHSVEDISELPVGVTLHGLTKLYGDRVAVQNLNVSFYEGHITSLLGHNGAGKTTIMSLLTGLFTPSSGSIEVYGRDMQSNSDAIRKDLGVCMQYDVLFEDMTTKEHLLLYGQIKAPNWSRSQLREQVRTILEETGMYAHRHKRVGTLSGGMKRKLSISIAFIGGSRLVVLDEPTTGVDPCSRRSIWDIVIQHKKNCTIIMSTHHLDEAEVLSDRIALLERGGLKCCGSPIYLKDKLGQGYKLTLSKKTHDLESKENDSAELKSFVQAHVPEARLKEAHGGDLVYSLPVFSSSSASSYRSLLTALDSNLDALQLGGYGIADMTLEEVFLQLTQDSTEAEGEDSFPSVSKAVSDTESLDNFSSDPCGSISSFGDKNKLIGLSTVSGLALAWQQMTAILIKRFHHSRRDWKGLIAQILLPVLFVLFAMGLGSIKSDLRHYPELELSPALYNYSPSYSFFRHQNPNSSRLADTMMSPPGMDNTCLDQVCTTSTNFWTSSGNSSKPFSVCKCTSTEQICEKDNFQPPHKKIPSSQIVYNLSGIDVENYLLATANDFIRNRYGGFSFGMPLPLDLQMDASEVPKNRTLSKVWFNPEGHHTMPAYLNSLNNFILRSNLPANKDPHKYGISVSSHPYFGRADDEDVIIQGMLHILVGLCVLTGYSITTASFAIYEVSEHHSGSKRLQHIAGISEPFYWAVNFFYDMLIYLIPVTITVAVIGAFQIPAFTDRQNLAAIILLLVLFGFATFPWMYLLAGVFKDAEMAFITYVCINLFISVNTILSTSVLYFMGQIAFHPESIQEVFNRLSQAFIIFPQFNFGNGLMKLARKNIEVQILSGYGIDAYQNPFSLDALGWMLIALFIQGLVFITLRLLINKSLLRKVRNLICVRKSVQQVLWEDEDEDVAAEHLRVSSGAAGSDILQVNQLTKVYQHLKKKVYAVKRLTVGIPAGECFGLLGVNGAGKTTTFKMLTGDISPTDGAAQIRDWDGRMVDIMECRTQGINIGYCPQEDALDNLLTGEEHLYFYGRIRGISKRELDGVVRYLLKRLELSYHRNIVTNGYSCGTRRKLSTALALIGHPQILLLDEPSSGMDPHTKRHLWKIISEEVKGKCAVVLTSHSMEECEALCSRIAIMVQGQFRCLGSLQHIKNRFGRGFTVKIYLSDASGDTETVTGFMQRKFPTTYLKNQHSAMLEYHVPVAPGGLADIFHQVESNKNALQIRHFSVSQTTLDEVFINFAMGNLDLDNTSINGEDEGDSQGSTNAVDPAS